MGTSKSGQSGTSRNSFSIGDQQNTNKYLYANILSTPTPAVRYNTVDFKWEFSNDGATYVPFYSLPASSNYQLLQYSTSSADWVAIDDIILPDGAARSINQESSAVNVVGYDLTISAQEIKTNDGTGGTLNLLGGSGDTGTDISGGDVYIAGGSNTGTGTVGNIAFHLEPISWQDGENIIYIGKATTVPTGSPTDGGFLYVDPTLKSLRFLGSSGTITTVASAEPHCPNCGRDFALEWENNKTDEYLAICVWCLTDQLSKAGIDLNSFMIPR